MKTSFSKFGSFAIAVALLGTLSFQSCKDDEVSPVPEEVVNPLEETAYYISGVVKSEGSALSGVSVESGSATATTDSNGAYELTLTSKSTATVDFSKDGYVSISATAVFPTDATNGAIVTLSQDLTVKAEAKPASSTEDNTLTFESSEETSYAVISIPAAALTEGVEISATEIIPAQDAVAAEAIATALSSATEEAVAVTSTFVALYLTPEGQEFEEEITISVPTTSADYFTNANHVKLVNNVWEVQGDAPFNAESQSYDLTLTGFSQHGVTADCNLTVGTSSSETLTTMTIDNIGNESSVADVLSYSTKSGWEVSSTEGVTDALYSQMVSYVAGVMGSSEGTTSIATTRDVAVSGDQKMVITVTQEVVKYKFEFDTSNGTEILNVSSYGSVSTTVVTTDGDMRTDHNS